MPSDFIPLLGTDMDLNSPESLYSKGSVYDLLPKELQLPSSPAPAPSSQPREAGSGMEPMAALTAVECEFRVVTRTPTEVQRRCCELNYNVPCSSSSSGVGRQSSTSAQPPALAAPGPPANEPGAITPVASSACQAHATAAVSSPLVSGPLSPEQPFANAPQLAASPAAAATPKRRSGTAPPLVQPPPKDLLDDASFMSCEEAPGWDAAGAGEGPEPAGGGGGPATSELSGSLWTEDSCSNFSTLSAGSAGHSSCSGADSAGPRKARKVSSRQHPGSSPPAPSDEASSVAAATTAMEMVFDADSANGPHYVLSQLAAGGGDGQASPKAGAFGNNSAGTVKGGGREVTSPGKAASLSGQFPSKADSMELKILVQPESQHRARYLTEGSRGSVKDSTQQGFPTVKLESYKEPVTLQVFVGTDSGRVKPHGFYQACRVTGRNTTFCSELEVEGTTVIEVTMDPANDMTLPVDCVGILKLRNADVEARIGPVRSKKKSTRVRLVFRVTIPRPDGPALTLQACSTPILCTQPAGTPEILKKSLHSCSPQGGEELFIIGKNFLKGVKVIFQENAAEGQVVWEAEAEIDMEFYHQNHLIVKVPPYCDPDIASPVSVGIFVNSSAGRSHEVQPFTYTPDTVTVPAKTKSIKSEESSQCAFEDPLQTPVTCQCVTLALKPGSCDAPGGLLLSKLDDVALMEVSNSSPLPQQPGGEISVTCKMSPKQEDMKQPCFCLSPTQLGSPVQLSAMSQFKPEPSDIAVAHLSAHGGLSPQQQQQPQSQPVQAPNFTPQTLIVQVQSQDGSLQQQQQGLLQVAAALQNPSMEQVVYQTAGEPMAQQPSVAPRVEAQAENDSAGSQVPVSIMDGILSAGEPMVPITAQLHLMQQGSQPPSQQPPPQQQQQSPQQMFQIAPQTNAQVEEGMAVSHPRPEQHVPQQQLCEVTAAPPLMQSSGSNANPPSSPLLRCEGMSLHRQPSSMCSEDLDTVNMVIEMQQALEERSHGGGSAVFQPQEAMDVQQAAHKRPHVDMKPELFHQDQNPAKSSHFMTHNEMMQYTTQSVPQGPIQTGVYQQTPAEVVEQVIADANRQIQAEMIQIIASGQSSSQLSDSNTFNLMEMRSDATSEPHGFQSSAPMLQQCTGSGISNMFQSNLDMMQVHEQCQPVDMVQGAVCDLNKHSNESPQQTNLFQVTQASSSSSQADFFQAAVNIVSSQPSSGTQMSSMYHTNEMLSQINKELEILNSSQADGGITQQNGSLEQAVFQGSVAPCDSSQQSDLYQVEGSMSSMKVDSGMQISTPNKNLGLITPQLPKTNSQTSLFQTTGDISQQPSLFQPSGIVQHSGNTQQFSLLVVGDSISTEGKNEIEMSSQPQAIGQLISSHPNGNAVQPGLFQTNGGIMAMQTNVMSQPPTLLFSAGNILPSQPNINIHMSNAPPQTIIEMLPAQQGNAQTRQPGLFQASVTPVAGGNQPPASLPGDGIMSVTGLGSVVPMAPGEMLSSQVPENPPRQATMFSGFQGEPGGGLVASQASAQAPNATSQQNQQAVTLQQPDLFLFVDMDTVGQSQPLGGGGEPMQLGLGALPASHLLQASGSLGGGGGSSSSAGGDAARSVAGAASGSLAPASGHVASGGSLQAAIAACVTDPMAGLTLDQNMERIEELLVSLQARRDDHHHQDHDVSMQE
ncbi:nuclear factor of activated T-cells 5 isoform X2 [Lampetra planeri]